MGQPAYISMGAWDNAISLKVLGQVSPSFITHSMDKKKHVRTHRFPLMVITGTHSLTLFASMTRFCNY